MLYCESTSRGHAGSEVSFSASHLRQPTAGPICRPWPALPQVGGATSGVWSSRCGGLRRLKPGLSTRYALVDPAHFLPTFQTALVRGAAMDRVGIYLAYQQFCRVNNVA